MASPKVIAAAQAAASWARARRATWTDTPLPRPTIVRRDAQRVPPRVAAPQPPPPPTSAPAPTRPAPLRITTALNEPAPAPELHAAEPTAAARALEAAAAAASVPAAVPAFPRSRRRGNKWIVGGVIAAGAVGALGVGTFVALRNRAAGQNAAARDANAPPQTAQPGATPAPTSGSLKVTSTPDGARVVIDGQDRGVTPLSIDNLPFGAHTVAIEGKTGSVQRSVMVTPDNPTALLDEQIFEGWVAIFSPVEIVISEGNRVLQPDDRNEIMLPPGRHQLRFVNKALEYDDTQTVVVKPGERTGYTVTPPKSTVSVTANDAAEVFLDGTKIGTTPVSAVAAAIGAHNLLVKRVAGAGEKRMPITVTVKPFSVAVTF